MWSHHMLIAHSRIFFIPNVRSPSLVIWQCAHAAQHTQLSLRTNTVLQCSLTAQLHVAPSPPALAVEACSERHAGGEQEGWTGGWKVERGARREGERLPEYDKKTERRGKTDAPQHHKSVRVARLHGNPWLCVIPCLPAVSPTARAISKPRPT